MSIVYFSHLCFTLPNPVLTAKLAAASLCFNWAAWKGRQWCIDNDGPIDNYSSKVVSLALTTFTTAFPNHSQARSAKTKPKKKRARSPLLFKSSPAPQAIAFPGFPPPSWRCLSSRKNVV